MQVILKLIRLKITAVNETIDLCQGHSRKNKNFFIRFWLPFVIKSIEPPIKCPENAGVYKWMHPGQANLDKFPAPIIMKKMNITNINITVVFYTIIKNVKVDLISSVEISKVTLMA